MKSNISYMWNSKEECERIFNQTSLQLNTSDLTVFIVFSLVITSCFITNLVSLLTIILSTRFQISEHVNMININVSSFLNIPAVIITNYTRKHGPCWMLDMSACRIFASLTIAPFIACLYSMLCIAYQWHKKVKSHSHILTSTKEAMLSVFLVWFVSFFPSVFVLIETLVPVKYDHRLHGCVYESDKGIGFAIFQGIQYILLTLLTGFYHLKIVYFVRKSRLQVSTFQESSIHQTSNSHKRRDIHLAKKFLVMFITFQALMDPVAVIVLFEPDLPQIIYDLSGMMLTLVLIAMPLLFIFSKKILFCKCLK